MTRASQAVDRRSVRKVGNEERDQRIRDLWMNEGLQFSQIAQRLGVSANTVSRVCRAGRTR